MVEYLLRQAEEGYRTDISYKIGISDELARREERLAALAKAKAEIEQRATERYSTEQAEYEKKLAERKAKEQESLLLQMQHL